MLEEVVRSKGVDVHVSAHADQLGSTQVVKSDIVVEQLGYPNDVLGQRLFTCRSDLQLGLVNFTAS
jgi:hypothetical protein